MSVPIPATESTRDRLIAAGAQIFARDGFSRSGVRDICEAAGGANVASIKYHFGDKVGLYRAVIESGIRTMRERAPVLPTAGSAEDRLREFLRQFLELTLIYRRNHPYITNIMKHELREPTELLDEIVQSVIQPMHATLDGLIAAATGGEAGSLRTRQQAGLVLSMCANLENSRAVLERLGAVLPADPESIAVFAAELTHNILYGIKGGSK